MLFVASSDHLSAATDEIVSCWRGRQAASRNVYLCVRLPAIPLITD